MKDVKIGFALTGSFCTLDSVLVPLEHLVELGADVTPILSEAVAGTDTRFGRAQDLIRRLESITGKAPIRTIPDAEPIGPKRLLDIVVVAPCTGNTLAKLAGGITDTTVTMACKAHLRNRLPVVLGVSTNDALSGNAANLASMLNRNHIYFIPLRQDDHQRKAFSLSADMELLVPAVRAALKGKQLQPLLLSPLP